ncbi:tetratricopeptide repeat protein [Patescibacteria group bacterium]
MPWLKRLSWLLIIAAIFIVNTNSISDADFWWHLKTGEYLWETKSIPHQDFWSHTASGREWTAHEWVPQVILYGVYRLASFNGLVCFTALMAVATYLILALVLKKRKVPGLVIQLVIFLASVVNAPFFIPRPQLFYFLLWAGLILILTAYDLGKKWSIYFIPILFIVWANLHASVHLPILAIGLYLAAKAISGVIHQQNIQALIKKQIILVVLTILGSVSALLNPNSYRVYTYILKGIPFLSKTSFEITEWGSMLSNLKIWQPWFYLSFYTFTGLVFTFAFLKTKNKKVLESGLIALPLILISLMVSKFLPLALILTAISLGISLKELFKKLEKSSFLPVLALGMGIIFLALALLYHYGLGRPIKPAWENFPKQAAEFVKREKIQGKMFNSYNWGGYLIWKLLPDYLTFIDGRYEMYEPDITADFEKVREGAENWEEILDKYEISFLFLPPRDDHQLFVNSGNWILVYFDDRAVVYVKKDDQNQSIIDKFGYHYIRPFWPSTYAEEEKIEEAIDEYLRSLKNDPNLYKSHYDLGILYFNQENLERAEFHFRQAIRIFPKSAAGHYNLAQVLQLRGKTGAAEREIIEYQWLVRE